MIPTLRTHAIASMALLCASCNGETLDAGTTFLAKVGKPTTTRATAAQMIDAITMDGDNLYFTCQDGWIYRLAKEGTEPPQQVASFPGNYAWGIAVDDASVYVTALVDAENGGVVVSAPKGGGTATTLAHSQSRPWGIAVDDSRIYWMDQGATPYTGSDVDGVTQGAVLSAPKSGGSATILAKVNVGDRIALDDEGVYWHETEAIRRVSKQGGPVTTLASSTVPTSSPNLIVADGRVFWAQAAGTWSISSVATTGSDPVTLVASLTQPSSLAVLDDTVYWSDAEESSVGAIRSVPTLGGNETVQTPASASGLRDDPTVAFVLVDESSFYIVAYWSEPSLKVVVVESPR